MKFGGVPASAKNKYIIRATAGVHYQDAKTTDYYYGVRNSEATANRKSYKAGSATTPFFGLEAVANITSNITMKEDLAYEKRANSVRRSPLIDDKKYDVQGKIGLSYWF